MKFTGKGKVVLAVGAHPDDVEFGCGGTIAKLVGDGAKVYIVVSTDGNRGSRQTKISKTELIKIRASEQKTAAKMLGASDVLLLSHEDGNLVANISFKEEVVRIIRKIRPDMVFTHDPAWFYKIAKNGAFINHNDHRATGEAVLDAVYPLSRDLLSFPEHVAQGLKPHKVSQVYLFNFDDPNFLVDISQLIDLKIDSINAHKSQIDNPLETRKWVEERLSRLGKKIKVKYAEGFTKLILN